MADLRQELVEALGCVVGSGPLTPDSQRRALDLLVALAKDLPRAEIARSAGAGARYNLTTVAPIAVAGETRVEETVDRRLVYVHGICQHTAGFSDPWWEALQPYVPTAFGAGTRGQTRLEVVWSDIVNRMAAEFATASHAVEPLVTDQGLPSARAAKTVVANEIKEVLRDRADRQALTAEVYHHGRDHSVAALAANEAPATGSLISVPGLSCIDDFSVYLTNDAVRQQIIDKFLAVVRPEFQAGHELDIVCHSWGTVVAYEGLRQLDDEGVTTPLVRNFFTVGAALSIGPVKVRLRPANRNGRKPASVRRWVNLDAYGDIIGGPLRGRPFSVDVDLVNLTPAGCTIILGLVNPSCSHGSYFDPCNLTVNRDIFAHFIDLF